MHPHSSPRPRTGPAVTLEMVAARAGVGRQTVSNAINSPELLRPQTLERVRHAIDELGYRPHRAAQALKTRASRLIGYGIRSSSTRVPTPVLDQFLHSLSEAADRAGYRVVLFAVAPGDDELTSYQQLLDEHGADGFVLSGTDRGDRRQGWLHERGVPFVAFGRTWSGKDVGDWVDVDGAAGTSAAVRHLAGLGHRRIGFLGWPKGSGVGDDRARGWQSAMRELGLPTRGRRVASPDDPEQATEAAEKLLATGATAVVAASDTLALGWYRALRRAGRGPGPEAAVIGFDDSPIAPLLFPSLSSLAQPLDAVGRTCMRLLLDRLGDRDRPTEHILLEPELVLRESV
ncbi:transcriptional regulator [Kitasatospora aureofaciens]|uniref:Transcriptional regulator n=1 Tax=Kitasatospora aureofaciens TaxID=1894 RepID=A0A1E7NGG9_KITAU|nr:LacI family DNA-binding transcriptional regulator [Kitasatospora aureofaciens]OEV39725.1 transcriptional regulator [Kitasatospora aureofaciens]UKZ10338.1 LacI family DNA-binding transcriptional regulator [Streptomyces viridifaciens]